MLLPRTFSRERSFGIQTAKVFPLESFAVYGTLNSSELGYGELITRPTDTYSLDEQVLFVHVCRSTVEPRSLIGYSK